MWIIIQDNRPSMDNRPSIIHLMDNHPFKMKIFMLSTKNLTAGRLFSCPKMCKPTDFQFTRDEFQPCFDNIVRN